jgi:high-affinity Fe2+/Pb2+ permease
MAEDIKEVAAIRAIDLIAWLVLLVAGVLAVTFVLGGNVMDLLNYIA